MYTNRFFAFVVCGAALASLGWSQGGQGGMAGGSGARTADGEVQQYDHILTPGDRGEWPITAKEGETIIVTASSRAFDPALEVVSEDGKVLAQNDDIVAGKQDAQVVYRFAKAGPYKILVKGYKSAAGGQYTLWLRRFVSVDAALGARTAGSTSHEGSQWLRITGKAGQTLAVAARASSFKPDLDVYAPSGEKVENFVESSSTDRRRRLVFRANADGDYYAKLSGQPDSTYAVTAAISRVATIAIGGPAASRKLEAGGVDVWTFEGKVGDFVRIDAATTGAGASVSLAYVPPSSSAGVEDPAQSPRIFTSQNKEFGTTKAMLRASGTYQITVSQVLDLPLDYSLSIIPAAKPMGDSEKPVLKLGDTDYWSFEAKKGEILQFDGKSDQFDACLALFDAEGQTVASNDDGGTRRNAMMTVLVPKSGLYYVQIGAYGNGGSGTYALQKATAPMRALEVGVKGEGSVGLEGAEIWTLKGHAGQTIVISARSLEFDTVVRIVGPDGVEVAKNDDGGEGTDSLLSVRLPLDGTYTVWIMGNQGGGKYTVRWIDLDR